MRYPDTTPMQFSGGRAFVETAGDAVWTELCDTVGVDEWFNVANTARRMTTLRHYANPPRYLRQVLKAVQADYQERPEAYDHQPPVRFLTSRCHMAAV